VTKVASQPDVMNLEVFRCTTILAARNLKWSALILACLIHPALSLGQDSTTQLSDEILRDSKSADFNRSVYYKNKLEFSLDTGWLPINIPFVFDFLTSGACNKTPLKYTLVPILPSLRWQMGNVGGPWILRGNWDLTFSGSFTVIPRGPETRYGAYIMGIRRNFVRPNWRIVPHLDGRAGLGFINAKEPKEVSFAQGQDFTFTVMLCDGVRYNFNPRYAISSDMTYMHISNLYLSKPKFPNYGINVYGPMVGFDIRLGKPKRESAQKGQ